MKVLDYSGLQSYDTKLKTYINELSPIINNPTFVEATLRENIVSGESVEVIFGKIQKWLTDLKSGAFLEINEDTFDYVTQEQIDSIFS